MQDQDQKTINHLLIALGILAFVALVFFYSAHTISANTVARYERQGALAQQQIERRIAPVGQVALLGGDALKAAQAAAVAAASKPAAQSKPLTGDQVFHRVCFACHASGAGGAPVVGNAAAWDPRIAKGLDTLKKHALNGFSGNSGVMPAKGGRPDLSDAEVIAAVKYMISQDPDAPASLTD